MQEAWCALGRIVAWNEQQKVLTQRQYRQSAGGYLVATQPDNAGWYVVNVTGGYERRIYSTMVEEGLNVWLPTRKERRYRKKAGGAAPCSRIIEVPIFHGYLFIRCVPSAEAWHGIKSFDHVQGIIGEDDHPAVLRDKEMAKLTLDVEGFVKDFSTGGWKFCGGDRVEIQQGLAQYAKGVIDKSYSGGVVVPVLIDGTSNKFTSLVPIDGLIKLD